jgi:hypothetical protein
MCRFVYKKKLCEDQHLRLHYLGHVLRKVDQKLLVFYFNQEVQFTRNNKTGGSPKIFKAKSAGLLKSESQTQQQ